jgi:hypothetical protein
MAAPWRRQKSEALLNLLLPSEARKKVKVKVKVYFFVVLSL